MPGLAEDLRLDDLIASGWTVEGPTQVNSGGLRVVLRYPFESPAEATDALSQISGPNGPLLNPALKRTVDGRTAAAWLRAAQHTPDTSGVELLTFHGAKGREFSVVVIIGADRGLLPHANARRQVRGSA